MPFLPAHRVANFGTSIFTEITQLAARHKAIDLSSGFPDTDGPTEAKAAVWEAMEAGKNQYALSHGVRELRQAVAEHARRFYEQTVDPESEVTVTNGAAEALHSITDGLINPGDEVIILEPYYEVYAPNVIMAGGAPRFVPLRPPNWSFDPDELAAAFNNRTRAILINTPHNPTGKVFSRAELETIAALCQKWNVIAISDEVYEHLIYDGQKHEWLAQLPGMAERAITVSSMSKTFSFTGWRIGWVLAPPDLTNAVRLAHQFVLDCSATPMQFGAARALALGDGYFAGLAADYQRKRDFLAHALRQAGLEVLPTGGGFFIMAGIEPLGFNDDFEFCKHLAANVGVAAIPPSAFYSERNKALGKRYARFAFCKTTALLEKAAEALQRLRPR
ncbi:MAG: aminotransferase class I/II-fold pyridoxal phosphate-dependent enzyme [Chloroflexi bacterium]|nr:aminotransferase class I/II-fold pyridoxal phosphate-dependent enzyme [Chloroflexota bacterium]